MDNMLLPDLDNAKKIVKQAMSLSAKSPDSDTAFSVGAIIETTDGTRFTWYSRETGETEHAEEVAMQKAIRAGKSLVGAILYCSLEPCSERASKSICCAQIIIMHQFAKVFISEREDSTFVDDCQWVEMLEKAGIKVVEVEI